MISWQLSSHQLAHPVGSCWYLHVKSWMLGFCVLHTKRSNRVLQVECLGWVWICFDVVVLVDRSLGHLQHNKRTECFNPITLPLTSDSGFSLGLVAPLPLIAQVLLVETSSHLLHGLPARFATEYACWAENEGFFSISEGSCDMLWQRRSGLGEVLPHITHSRAAWSFSISISKDCCSRAALICSTKASVRLQSPLWHICKNLLPNYKHILCIALLYCSWWRFKSFQSASSFQNPTVKPPSTSYA